MINYRISNFLMSVSSVCHLPSNDVLNMEVAFVGYSNSGKSSVINVLTDQKKLNKVSGIPGRTQYINILQVVLGICLLDFPGYGYSLGLKKKRNYWYDEIVKYLKNRKSLKGIVIVMDIRSPMKDLDQNVLQYVYMLKIPVFILLNKSDKFSKNAQKKVLLAIEQHVQKFSFSCFIHVALFSSKTKFGVGSLKKILEHWLI